MTRPKAREMVSGNEAVEAARAVVDALTTYESCNEMMPGNRAWHHETYREAVHNLALPMAHYILSLAPGKDAREVAEQIVAQSELICGPCGGPLPNPDCGHAKNGVVGCCVPSTDQPLTERIATAITAAVAAAVEKEREACAHEASSFSTKDDATIADIPLKSCARVTQEIVHGTAQEIAAAIRARRTP